MAAVRSLLRTQVRNTRTALSHSLLLAQTFSAPSERLPPARPLPLSSSSASSPSPRLCSLVLLCRPRPPPASREPTPPRQRPSRRPSPSSSPRRSRTYVPFSHLFRGRIAASACEDRADRPRPRIFPPSSLLLKPRSYWLERTSCRSRLSERSMETSRSASTPSTRLTGASRFSSPPLSSPRQLLGPRKTRLAVLVG